MNYKNALVALAATVTMGLTPVFAGTTANAATTPKATATYWQKDVRYVQLTKNIKVNKAKLVKTSTGNQLKLTKATKTLKKGFKTYVRKSNGAWLFINVSSNNKATYYVSTNSKLVNTTNFMKVTTNTTTNTNTNNNNNTNSNKTAVAVNSNYKTADTDYYTSTDYGTATFSPNSKAYTSNGVTINPGDQYKVKAVTTGSTLSYQFDVGGQTVTVPQSDSFAFLNINVFASTSADKKTTNYVSTYAPDSTSAVVTKSFQPADNAQWITVSNLSSNGSIKNIYIYNKASNKWLKGHLENNKYVLDYQ